MPLPATLPRIPQPFPALLACALVLAACGSRIDGPTLLSPAEIRLAAEGAGAPADDAALLARAANLSARAEQLRRSSIDQHERRRLEERAHRLAGL